MSAVPYPLPVTAPRMRSEAASRLPIPVIMLLAYLGAITIFGKGPTYLGYPPLYWGELTLALLVAWAAWTGFVEKTDLLRAALSKWIAAFMLLGAAITIVSVPRWGLDAVRDAALWYYGTFYFIGLFVASDDELGNRIWSALVVFWVLAVLWGLADASTGGTLSESGPRIPGRGYAVVSNSHHELRQHMAIGAFLILCTRLVTRRPLVHLLLAPAAVAALAVFLKADGRGVKIGIALGFLVVFALGFSKRATGLPVKLLGLGAAAALVLYVMAAFTNIDLVRATGTERFIYAGPGSPAQGTAYWRQMWWENLVHHTLTRSPVFGLGFGENLSAYNPFMTFEQLQDAYAVRSPHNFNLTVMGRMGLAGLALWCGVLGLGFWTLATRLWRGGTGGVTYTPRRWEELNVWMLMLICTWVNASFGVLMEGPVLGIWFWFALGFAIKRSEVQEAPAWR